MCRLPCHKVVVPISNQPMMRMHQVGNTLVTLYVTKTKASAAVVEEDKRTFTYELSSVLSHQMCSRDNSHNAAVPKPADKCEASDFDMPQIMRCHKTKLSLPC